MFDLFHGSFYVNLRRSFFFQTITTHTVILRLIKWMIDLCKINARENLRICFSLLFVVFQLFVPILCTISNYLGKSDIQNQIHILMYPCKSWAHSKKLWVPSVPCLIENSRLKKLKKQFIRLYAIVTFLGFIHFLSK